MMKDNPNRDKKTDNIALAVSNLDSNMIRMVCRDNGIDPEKVIDLNRGLQKLVLSGFLRHRLKTHGSVFIVDRFFDSIYEIDLGSKSPRPVDPSRFGTQEP
jgi:hypothetical protein